MRVDTVEKPDKCCLCGKAFCDESFLKYHITVEILEDHIWQLGYWITKIHARRNLVAASCRAFPVDISECEAESSVKSQLRKSDICSTFLYFS